MTASLRRRSCSPAAPPLEDDDLLSEILLRLPTQPSSLPRASAVCKRWRHLVSDPGFCRRFRIHHRRSAPLLGFFDRFEDLSFLPTLEAPNRIPPERFSLPRDGGGDCVGRPLGCRHGLVLIFLPRRPQVLVWDPVNGYQHRVDVPPGLVGKTPIQGAVLRTADVQHFQVVLVVADGDDVQHRRAVACVYSSETGVWGCFISTPIPYEACGSFSTIVNTDDAVLAGDSLYWLLAGNFDGILEFDLEKQRLAVIPVPVSIYGGGTCFKVMRAEGGGLGFVFTSMSDYTAQLWRRKTDSDGVASWVLARTIELDKLFHLKNKYIKILGYAEQNNVLLLDMYNGFFLFELESLQFKRLPGVNVVYWHHAFESVYAAETCTGGGHNGADLLLNT